MNNINERLKQIRQKLGFSQQKLADTLGLQRSIIADIERGKVKKPSVQLLRKLEEKFNINPDYLLTGEGDMYKKDNNKKTKELPLKEQDYTPYVYEYALHQIKEIKDPVKAAKEFKKIANEFLKTLSE